jgi:hypothetical protein
MATDRPSNYAAISLLYLRIAETMDDARIVVSDGAAQAERGRKAIPMNCHAHQHRRGFDLT